MKRVRVVGLFTFLLVVCLLLTGKPVRAAQGINLQELHFYEGDTLSYLLTAQQTADPAYAVGLVRERYVDDKSCDFYGDPFYLQAVYAQAPESVLDPTGVYGPFDRDIVDVAEAVTHYILANGYADYSKDSCNNSKYSGADKHECYYITQVALYLEKDGVLLIDADRALAKIAPLKAQNPAIYDKIEQLARDAHDFALNGWRALAELPLSVTAPHTEDASLWTSETLAGEAGLRSPLFSVNSLAKELTYTASDPRVRVVRVDEDNPSSDYYLWVSEKDYLQMDGAQVNVSVDGTAPQYYYSFYNGSLYEQFTEKNQLMFIQPVKENQQSGQLASTLVNFPSAGLSAEKLADRTKITEPGRTPGIYEPGEKIDYTIRVTCTAETPGLPIRVAELPDQKLLALAQSYGFVSRCVDAEGKAVSFSKESETEVLLRGMTKGQTAELHFVLQLKNGLTQGAQQLANTVTAGYDAETFRPALAADMVQLRIPAVQPDPETPKTYVTVTFVDAAGNVIKTVRLEKGDCVEKGQFPAAQELSGWTFSCWMTGNTVFTENTRVEDNLTVKAVYRTSEDAGGGTGGGIDGTGSGTGSGDGYTGGTGQTDGTGQDGTQGDQTDSTGKDSTQGDKTDSTGKDSTQGDKTDTTGKDSTQGDKTDSTGKDSTQGVKTDSTVTSGKTAGTLTSGSALDGSPFYSTSSGYTAQGTGTYSLASGTGTSPKTGDSADLLLWAGILLLSAGGILLGTKRKRNG